MSRYQSVAYIRLVNYRAGAHDIVARRRHDDPARTPGEIFTTYDLAVGLQSQRELKGLIDLLGQHHPEHRIIRMQPSGQHWEKEVPIISLDQLVARTQTETTLASGTPYRGLTTLPTVTTATAAVADID